MPCLKSMNQKCSYKPTDDKYTSDNDEFLVVNTEHILEYYGLSYCLGDPSTDDEFLFSCGNWIGPLIYSYSPSCHHDILEDVVDFSDSDSVGSGEVATSSEVDCAFYHFIIVEDNEVVSHPDDDIEWTEHRTYFFESFSWECESCSIAHEIARIAWSDTMCRPE